jgi:hypothetical protein
MLDSTAMHVSSGFVGEPHPSYPASEDWVFGSILFLFLLFAISFIRSSHWLFETSRSFFKIKQRSSIFIKTTLNDFQSRIFLVTFSLGVLSLFLYAVIFDSQQEFSFLVYLMLLGLSVVFFVLKYFLAEIIGYVFTDKKSMRLASESYLNLLSYLGIIQFPLLLFFIYSNENVKIICLYLSLFFLAVAAIILTIKLFQIFFDKIVVSFYILLYLCALEIAPFVFLIWLFRMIVLDV